MSFRGFSAYTDYSSKIENKNNLTNEIEDEETTNYSSTTSSEESENQGSNSYEILEKLNNHVRYSFNLNELENNELEHNYYHTDIYSLLKQSLSTPPPELG